MLPFQYIQYIYTRKTEIERLFSLVAKREMVIYVCCISKRDYLCNILVHIQECCKCNISNF
jgi:hypothetical protein